MPFLTFLINSVKSPKIMKFTVLSHRTETIQPGPSCLTGERLDLEMISVFRPRVNPKCTDAIERVSPCRCSPRKVFPNGVSLTVSNCVISGVTH